MRSSAYTLVFLVLTLLSCSHQPSEEELEKIELLQTELLDLQQEVRRAEDSGESLSGGLVKGLIDVRIEILKTTEALLEQRIQALEAGAEIDIVITAIEPNHELVQAIEREISDQEQSLEKARVDAARYSGGLVGAMKAATVATEELSLASLQHRRLAALYGFPDLAIEEEVRGNTDHFSQSTADPDYSSVEDEIIEVVLLKKQFSKQRYEEYIFFDVELTASGLDKPARAIKGILHLEDLFGEAHFNLRWTIDGPISPGETLTEKGSGFEFNQFMAEHKWVLGTDLSEMSASFTVTNILYTDGTRRDF